MSMIILKWVEFKDSNESYNLNHTGSRATVATQRRALLVMCVLSDHIDSA